MTLDPKALEAAARVAAGNVTEGQMEANPDCAEEARSLARDVLTAYLAALPPVDVAGLVRNLIKIADASRREDGSDIPLGQQVRKAATALERVARERDEHCAARNMLVGNDEWNGVELAAMRTRAEAAERERDEARTRELSALQSASTIQDAAMEYKARAEAAERERDEADQWAGYFKKEHDDTISAVGQQWFLDPPDGGSVSLPEGVKRIDDARDAAERERDAAQARIAALEGALQNGLAALEGVLCDPRGRAAIEGSDADLALIDAALDKFRAALADAPKGGDGWLPIESAPKDGALGEIADNNAARLLRQCYVTLAFAFRRLHESSRSRDGELCLDFQKVRAQIEDHFKKIGVKL